MKQMAEHTQPDADADIQNPNLKPLGRAQNMNLKFVWSPEVAKFFVANENYASLNNQVLAINYTLHRCKISFATAYRMCPSHPTYFMQTKLITTAVVKGRKAKQATGSWLLAPVFSPSFVNSQLVIS